MPEQSSENENPRREIGADETKRVDSFGDQPRLKLFFKNDARSRLSGVQLPQTMSLGLINNQMFAREPEEFQAPTVKRIQSFNAETPRLHEGNVVFVEDSSAVLKFDIRRPAGGPS